MMTYFQKGLKNDIHKNTLKIQKASLENPFEVYNYDILYICSGNDKSTPLAPFTTMV